MVFSKYGPLVERLRYVASHPPELPVPWASRDSSGGPASTPSEGSYQRSPLYRAERRMNRGISTPWVLYSLEDVLNYGTAVLKRTEGIYSRASYPVSFRQGPEGSASYLGGTIMVPLPVRQTTILHELAHHLPGSSYDHSEVFQGAYVALLTQEMGEDTAKKLLVNLQ
jgi:hypothetical protein